MPSFILSQPNAQYIDANGNVYAGAKINTYETGTTTPAAAYQDSDLTTPHANPVVADAAGIFDAIYLDSDTSYKIVVTDSDDNTIQTIDPVNAFFGSALLAINELTPAANKVPYFTSATAAALADLTPYARNNIINATNEAALKQAINAEADVDFDSFQAAQSQATWEAGSGTTESKVSPAKVHAAIAALANAERQAFSSSDTWTKPGAVNTDSVVIVRIWGAGGGGGGTADTGGGGGGGYKEAIFLASDLGATETVTIGAGGDGAAGGNSTFGSWATAYGGGFATAGSDGGGGGGSLYAAGSNGSGDNGGAGGIGGGAGGGDSTVTTGGNAESIWGGGGGGRGDSGGAAGGGKAVFGGGGGEGDGTGTGGASEFGGDGGDAGANGDAPGGGGGSNDGVGGDGYCEVITLL